MGMVLVPIVERKIKKNCPSNDTDTQIGVVEHELSLIEKHTS
jgi:hypothetical protein